MTFSTAIFGVGKSFQQVRPFTLCLPSTPCLGRSKQSFDESCSSPCLDCPMLAIAIAQAVPQTGAMSLTDQQRAVLDRLGPLVVQMTLNASGAQPTSPQC